MSQNPDTQDRIEQVKALYEQERQREAQARLLEPSIRGEVPSRAAEGAELDEPVSNDGSEAAFLDISGPSFGQEGQPTAETPEAESGPVVIEAAAVGTSVAAAAPEVDESLLLDAYWASYGDASTRALLRSQPPEASILEVVIGIDDRQEIASTSDYPWRAICSLLMTAADGMRFIGTGWLVGPRLVLTAGHCLYFHQFGGWATQIEVIPGRRGASRPFGSVMAHSFRSVRGWTEKQAREYDYGAILLPASRRLGDEVGWFGYAVRAQSALSSAVVNISGYPGDKPPGTQWFHSKELAEVEERVLTYSADTAGGQSGAPVWIKQADGSRYGVGIHTNGHVTGNSATRISSTVYDNIQAWKAAVP
jgi:V8-like Glu-specific endopeptidase